MRGAVGEPFEAREATPGDVLVAGDVLAGGSGAEGHVCQMFADEAFPARRIAAYLGDALQEGGAAMALATPLHGAAIASALQELGTDVAAAVQCGRLVLLDAEQLAHSLADVAAADRPNFEALIGRPVAAALARYGRVRMYGEIVDVLARDGNVAGAIELERAWNDLLAGRPAQLLCGYAIHNFADAGREAAFRSVCELHDGVEPVADDTLPSADPRRLAAELQRATAALENEALRRRDLEAQRELLAGAERLALSRAQRAYEAAQYAQRRLQLLSSALHRIADARLDLAEIVDTVADEVTRADFAHCSVIHLRDGERPGALRLAAIRDASALASPAAARTLADVPLPIGEGFIGAVAQSGRAARIASWPEGLGSAQPADLLSLGWHALSAVVAVPLRASGELLGTLTAGRQAPSPPFTDDDVQALEQLAARAALAIENALLYARAQKERKRAEDANRTKDEFLAMLGHELRNPLSPILTAVQLMRLRAGDALTKERTIIERQVNRMVRLVDDLLDVSRITRGNVQLKREQIELAPAIAEAIETASPMLEERAHKLVTSVPCGLIVDADADRLEQVIANLLINAAKYTPQGGKIEVTARVHEGVVAIGVRDNGVGIEPHVLARIFEPFAQGEQASDRALGGLGLGLAIARSLAELHGGRLHAHSDGPGRGSEFTLELPLVRASQPAQRRSVEAGAAARSPRGLRVLVVDDNCDAAEALAEALADMGLQIEVAHDGPSALEVARVFRPQLAVLDIGLPVMDGYELCRKLAALCGDAPPKAIAVTGYGQSSDRARARAAGFAAHLVKPVDLDRLESVIAELSPPG